jgi:hypothetical protein
MQKEKKLTLKRRTLSNNKEIWYYIEDLMILMTGTEEECRKAYERRVSDLTNIPKAPRIIADEIIEEFIYKIPSA